MYVPPETRYPPASLIGQTVRGPLHPVFSQSSYRPPPVIESVIDLRLQEQALSLETAECILARAALCSGVATVDTQYC
jgi:hypothetical protein